MKTDGPQLDRPARPCAQPRSTARAAGDKSRSRTALERCAVSASAPLRTVPFAAVRARQRLRARTSHRVCIARTNSPVPLHRRPRLGEPLVGHAPEQLRRGLPSSSCADDRASPRCGGPRPRRPQEQRCRLARASCDPPFGVSPASIARMEFETRAIHAGQEPDPATGAVITPIYQTSTYVQEAVGVTRATTTRASANPTRSALETALASLEGAEHGIAFSSGLGATTTLMHLVDPGERVVLIADVYGGVYRMTSQVYEPKGYRFTYVPAEEFDDEPRGAPRRRRRDGVGRDAVEPAAERRRHPPRRRRRARASARSSPSTTPSRRRTSSSRSSSAPTSSSTRRRSTSAGTPT